MDIPVTFNGDPNQEIGSFSTDDEHLLHMLSNEVSFELRPIRGQMSLKSKKVEVTELTLMYFEARPKHQDIPLTINNDSSKVIGTVTTTETENGLEATCHITDEKVAKMFESPFDSFSVPRTKKKKKRLKIRCDRCGKKLKKPGGLLFGPPNKKGRCDKYHLCRGCYGEVTNGILIEKIKATFDRPIT